MSKNAHARGSTGVSCPELRGHSDARMPANLRVPTCRERPAEHCITSQLGSAHPFCSGLEAKTAKTAKTAPSSSAIHPSSAAPLLICIGLCSTDRPSLRATGDGRMFAAVPRAITPERIQKRLRSVMLRPTRATQIDESGALNLARPGVYVVYAAERTFRGSRRWQCPVKRLSRV
jgi:hypothetical protein